MGPGRVTEPIMGASTHACQCGRGLALIRLLLSGCMPPPASNVQRVCILYPVSMSMSVSVSNDWPTNEGQRPAPEATAARLSSSSTLT